MSKNDDKTGKKLFQKDGPGGPGRGNVKDNLEGLDVWQATEQIIRKQMSSGKGADQLTQASRGGRDRRSRFAHAYQTRRNTAGIFGHVESMKVMSIMG